MQCSSPPFKIEIAYENDELFFFFFLSSKEERNSIVAVKCLHSFFKIYAVRNVHLCLNVTKVQEGALRQSHLSMCINIQKLLRRI